MGRFRESERINQSKFKSTSPYISDLSRLDGVYREKPRSFCLPSDRSIENLYPPIQESALAHFTRNNIKWHQGINRKPSNHLCSSQVFCVNFLFPFADQSTLLKHLLHPIFPCLDEMVPVEDGYFVSFEWIGEKNYLQEKISKNRTRTRGALFTSADSIVMFNTLDNKRHIVLIEWKYTESYTNRFLRFSSSGTDRFNIYNHLFQSDDCPINKSLLPSYDSLFYDPFDQLMRQQFLANEMEKAHEMGADIVSVLHISPEHNNDFKKNTSSALNEFGDSPTLIWKSLLAKERFRSISTEKLFSFISGSNLAESSSWVKYIESRYNWITDISDIFIC